MPELELEWQTLTGIADKNKGKQQTEGSITS
jgi:hypothetical protein